MGPDVLIITGISSVMINSLAALVIFYGLRGVPDEPCDPVIGEGRHSRGRHGGEEKEENINQSLDNRGRNMGMNSAMDMEHQSSLSRFASHSSGVQRRQDYGVQIPATKRSLTLARSKDNRTFGQDADSEETFKREHHLYITEIPENDKDARLDPIRSLFQAIHIMNSSIELSGLRRNISERNHSNSNRYNGSIRDGEDEDVNSIESGLVSMHTVCGHPDCAVRRTLSSEYASVCYVDLGGQLRFDRDLDIMQQSIDVSNVVIAAECDDCSSLGSGDSDAALAPDSRSTSELAVAVAIPILPRP